ncbi:phytoene/squalene synthase family protein [soil metagenome]
MAAGDHCFDLVRSADKDRFLASLFAPDELRPHLHALYAFNIELTRIRESVSEPSLGEIRLQWWNDAITGAASRTGHGHPVVRDLSHAIQAFDLPRQTFINMIEARRFDLYVDPMPSLNDLEGYLGETSSALIQLAGLILDPAEAMQRTEASGFAGVAMGLTGLLRSLPLHRARGQCYVPRDMLEKHGLSVIDVLGGGDRPALAILLADLRAVVADRYASAREAARGISPKLLPALLPAGLVPLYLGRLATLGTRSLSEVAESPQWRRQFHLYRCMKRRSL